MRAKHNLSWHISPVLAEIVNGACWLVELTLSPLRAPWHGRLMGHHSSPLEEETHTAINQPFTYHAKSAYYELW